MTQTEALGLVAYLNRAGMLPAMEGQAAVWQDALWDVRAPDAMEAARRLVRQPGRVAYVKPGDLLAEVRKVRADRIGGRRPPAPPEPLEPLADLEFQRLYLVALGDGLTEVEADRRACGALRLVRGQLPPADLPRLRALMAGRAESEDGGDGD
jgi:hypothetical protein